MFLYSTISDFTLWGTYERFRQHLHKSPTEHTLMQPITAALLESLHYFVLHRERKKPQDTHTKINAPYFQKSHQNNSVFFVFFLVFALILFSHTNQKMSAVEIVATNKTEKKYNMSNTHIPSPSETILYEPPSPGFYSFNTLWKTLHRNTSIALQFAGHFFNFRKVLFDQVLLILNE